MSTTQERAMKWLFSDDTGSSSEAIVQHMLSISDKCYSYPSDVSALGRCLRLLKLFPEWKPRIVWLECEAQVNALPVSEAKAQGVVQWPEADEIMQMAFEEGQPADDASGYYFELEEFDLFIERLISEVARLNAAPAAPAADAGLSLAEWAKDAEEWGPALNEAGWLFISELNEDPQKSALIFNNTKGPLRAAIMKYAEIVAAHRAKGVV